MTFFVVLVIVSLTVSAVVMDAQYAMSRGWAPLWKKASDHSTRENNVQDGEPPMTIELDGRIELSDTYEIHHIEPMTSKLSYDLGKIVEDDELWTITEVGARLDLARAYVDMGNPEGARSILEEVLDEGDEKQREQAQHLLDDLAS